MQVPAGTAHRDFDGDLSSVRRAVDEHIRSLQDLHASLEETTDFPLPFKPQVERFEDLLLITTGVGCRFQTATSIVLGELPGGQVRVSVLTSGGNKAGMEKSVFDAIARNLAV